MSVFGSVFHEVDLVSDFFTSYFLRFSDVTSVVLFPSDSVVELDGLVVHLFEFGSRLGELVKELFVAQGFLFAVLAVGSFSFEQI